jgi:regulator of sirC expression with transglutaminase-like and TPR domain
VGVIDMPKFCRPEAYKLFGEQLPGIEHTENLWRATAAIAMHAIDDVSLEAIDRRLADLADRVRRGANSGQEVALQAHLHRVIFDEEGFAGNLKQYRNALNSYLPVVLETRCGLPILLSLVYKVVAERVSLRVEGVNSPGHFLCRAYVAGQPMLIDPFFGGKLLTPDEARRRLSDMVGPNSLPDRELFPSATHRQWLSRILMNLQRLFEDENRRSDLYAITELKLLLSRSAA